MIRVTVIIPAHNAELWVGAALESVRVQTLPPHEVIVIDDGSNDGTLEAVRATGVASLVLERRYGNAAAARNAGIERATGDWIAFLDADDRWESDHLERADHLLARGKGNVAYLAHARYIGEYGGKVPSPDPWLLEPTIGLPDHRFLDLLIRHMSFCNCTVLMQRERVEEVGAYTVSQLRRHDFELFLRVIHERTWAYNPKPGAIILADTPGSISRASVSAEYFYLRALLRNRDRYPQSLMRRGIHLKARQALTVATLDGTSRDRERAMALAWPELTMREKLFFRMHRLAPGLWKKCILWRRHWISRYK